MVPSCGDSDPVTLESESVSSLISLATGWVLNAYSFLPFSDPKITGPEMMALTLGQMITIFLDSGAG